MRRFLIIGLFALISACANTHVDQRNCTHDCHANSHPTPSYSYAAPIYYQPRAVNCVPVGYPAVVHCGYSPL